jgi:hypothetical protein
MFILKMVVGAVVALALLPASALADVVDLGPYPGINKLDVGPRPGLPEIVNPARPVHVRPAPIVVSVGDSAISGEAGRWAGNTNGIFASTDALGPFAYDDNATGTAETIPGCHRSKSAEVHIGGGVTSVNLACSGAKTTSYIEPSTGNFKPGLDFYNVPGIGKGQAQMLQEYAATHPHTIRAVAVLIGTNDYAWTNLAATCIKDWAFSQPELWAFGTGGYCINDPGLQATYSYPNTDGETRLIRNGLANIHLAMSNAGYSDDQYKLIVQTYASEIPNGGGFRYPENLSRQSTGGCGIHDIDATWVNTAILPTINRTITTAAAQLATLAPSDGGGNNVAILDASNALVGHRLCEKGVHTLEEAGISSWRDPRAVDQTEWVQRIRTPSINPVIDSLIPPITPPYDYQENAHPNYWAQLALRNCFRQAYNNGAPHGGMCTFSGLLGLNSMGEPNMTLR